MLTSLENIAIIQCDKYNIIYVKSQKRRVVLHRVYCASQISAIIVQKYFLSFRDFISHWEWSLRKLKILECLAETNEQSKNTHNKWQFKSHKMKMLCCHHKKKNSSTELGCPSNFWLDFHSIFIYISYFLLSFIF